MARRHFLPSSSLRLTVVGSVWRCPYPSLVPHSPQLITELLGLADAWGWSVEDLARELRVDRTTLLQYRSGRRALTVRALARIARRFGEQRMVRDLVWHHLAVECSPDAPAGSPASAPTALSPSAARNLRAYVDRFGKESLHGRGLYLVGTDATMLSAALLFLQAVLEEAGIPACRLRADRTPSASEVRAALAAPVLVLERFDFACAAVQSLARQRGDLVRPTVLTSMRPPGDITDPYLRRVLAGMTRLVDITPASFTLPTDGSVPTGPEAP